MRYLILGKSPQANALVEQFRKAGLVLAHNAEPAPFYDWVIFAMQGWEVNDMAFQLLQALPPTQFPNMLSLVEGIGATETLASYFGAERVVRGIYREGQGIVVANHALNPVMGDFLRPEIWGKIEFADDLTLAWSHLFWQLPLNALPTILNMTPEEVRTNPQMFAIERTQLREALKVMDTLGIKPMRLPWGNVPRLAQAVRWLPLSLLARFLKNRPAPSLLPDIQNQVGRSDAAYLNGAVAHMAYTNNFSAPINHALAVTVTDIAEGRAKWTQFQRNLPALETIIRIMSRH
jgi:ketopantoate reductase